MKTLQQKLKELEKESLMANAYIATAIDFYTEQILKNKTQFLEENKASLFNPESWVAIGEKWKEINK